MSMRRLLTHQVGPIAERWIVAMDPVGTPAGDGFRLMAARTLRAE